MSSSTLKTLFLTYLPKTREMHAKLTTCISIFPTCSSTSRETHVQLTTCPLLLKRKCHCNFAKQTSHSLLTLFSECLQASTSQRCRKTDVPLTVCTTLCLACFAKVFCNNRPTHRMHNTLPRMLANVSVAILSRAISKPWQTPGRTFVQFSCDDFTDRCRQRRPQLPGQTSRQCMRSVGTISCRFRESLLQGGHTIRTFQNNHTQEMKSITEAFLTDIANHDTSDSFSVSFDSLTNNYKGHKHKFSIDVINCDSNP